MVLGLRGVDPSLMGLRFRVDLCCTFGACEGFDGFSPKTCLEIAMGS